jgi:signal transduction histidine kinase
MICNPEYDVGSIPPQLALTILFIPLAVAVVFKGVHYGYVFLAVLIGFSFIIASIAYARAVNAIPFIAMNLFFPILCRDIIKIDQEEFSSREMRTIDSERAHAEQEAALERERRESELRESEMRHMIGNVSHDLKTVNLFYLILLLSNMTLFSASCSVYGWH